MSRAQSEDVLAALSDIKELPTLTNETARQRRRRTIKVRGKK